MGRNKEIERQFIKALAQNVRDKVFIITSLQIADTDEKRKEIIEFLNDNPESSKKEIEEKLFYMSI